MVWLAGDMKGDSAQQGNGGVLGGHLLQSHWVTPGLCYCCGVAPFQPCQGPAPWSSIRKQGWRTVREGTSYPIGNDAPRSEPGSEPGPSWMVAQQAYFDMTCRVPMKCHDKWLENGKMVNFMLYIFFLLQCTMYMCVCICSFLAIRYSSPRS